MLNDSGRLRQAVLTLAAARPATGKCLKIE